MPQKKVVISSETKAKPMRPALSPEARENQMIALAVDLAEQQLRDGTASSQVITHFLKLATSKENLEKKILEKQMELLQAKTDEIKSNKKTEELYKNAIGAFREYSGQVNNNIQEDDDNEF